MWGVKDNSAFRAVCGSFIIGETGIKRLSSVAEILWSFWDILMC
jgi:hypothetical protein